MAFDLEVEKTKDFALDPYQMRERFASDGLIHETGNFLVKAYEGLGPLLSGPRCSLDVLLKVDEITHSSIWLSAEYGAPTGALLIVPLNASGAAAAAASMFNPLNPDLSHVCKPGGIVGAYYGWLFAGATPIARRRVLKGAKRICDGEFGAVPIYARAASAKGASTLLKLGFMPRASAPDQFVMQPGRPA